MGSAVYHGMVNFVEEGAESAELETRSGWSIV
jgi:hypothetical protein